MPSRVVQRSAVLAACLSLTVSAVALADVVMADGDVVEPSNQTFIELEPVSPGAVVEFDVWFELQCKNGSHAVRESTITMELGFATLSGDMAVSAEPGTIIVPDDWPLAPTICNGTPTERAATPARVTLIAPTEPDDDYPFTLVFVKSPATGTTGFTAINGTIDVVGNTPPVLHVPEARVEEGNTTGGWTGAYGVSATDAEDDPDPTPSCTPAAGTVLPVGETTTVECTVEDDGGLSDGGSFTVTVVDTTPPSLAGVPGDLTATTSGAPVVVTWPDPTATDVVDASPTVGCSPASGSSFRVGTTEVTCTARDDAGKTDSATFSVTVLHASAVFEQPVGNAGVFTVSSSRTIPVKVQLLRDGAEVTTGEAWVWLARCGDPAAKVAQLDWQGSRWQGHLDTGGLAAGCYQVTVRSGGTSFGGFELRVEGTATTASKPTKKG